MPLTVGFVAGNSQENRGSAVRNQLPLAIGFVAGDSVDGGHEVLARRHALNDETAWHSVPGTGKREKSRSVVPKTPIRWEQDDGATTISCRNRHLSELIR